jgi:hypothetical protein
MVKASDEPSPSTKSDPLDGAYGETWVSPEAVEEAIEAL